MNSILLKEFTVEEIDRALAQMQLLKASGPDDFEVCFYQKHWSIIGGVVYQAILNFLNNGMFDPMINYTHLALIPKTPNAAIVCDYHPISLCNVLYKIIAKVLANRLKQVLPSVISQHQRAFLSRRLITDNVLVAYEALHTMDTRLKGKNGFMAIKLNMSKAYDRVEWTLFEEIMRRLGFAEQWISLITTCVRSATYSVLVNGSPLGCIYPTRGLRQRDPLSPYMFLLCVEGLSSMLMRVENDGLITRVPISHRGRKLSHLFFADDSLPFY
jgi:hypothetical protein